MDRIRPSPRYEWGAPVSYEGADVVGEGTVANISASGALLEPASPPLAPGSVVDLRITRRLGGSEVNVSSEVIRATDSGFAVRFRDLDRDVVALLRELLPAG